jgi:hypothetical protein
VFNGRIYQQQDGLAMGSPLSPLLADIYLDHFEQLLLSSNHPLVGNILHWYRYVDDIFCVWTGTVRQLNGFLIFLNSRDKHLNFTIELEKERSLNFLDSTISVLNNKFDFAIFRKECYTDTVIHNDSRHHFSQKLSAFHSMLHRLCSIPMSQENVCKELQTIKYIAQSNRYKESLIDRLYRKKQSCVAKSAMYGTPSNIKPQWRRFPFLGNISLKVQRILPTDTIKPVFYNKTNLNHILCHTKDKIEPLHRSGVYKLTCNDCNQVYIGKTGRRVETRAKEYQTCFEKNIPHPFSPNT